MRRRSREVAAISLALVVVLSVVAVGATVPTAVAADGPDRGDRGGGVGVARNATDGGGGSTVGTAGVLTTAAAGDNLLSNPGCEASLGGSSSDWTVNATSVRCSDLSFSSQSPARGSNAFADFDDDNAAETFEQVVAVTAGTEYRFTGAYGTDNLTIGDAVTVELRFLDASGDVLGGGEVTRTGLQSTSTTAFDVFETSTTAPAGAVEARVSITLTDVGGTDYSDAYVDDLSLAPAPTGVTAVDDGPFAADVGDTLSPSDTLFDNNGNGSDSLGSGATVASFGGGDLGGTVTTNGPGETVPLAGGNLTVNGDGSFSLVNPTDGGRYAFDYRLSDGSESDDASVVIAVADESLVTPSCESGSGAPPGWSAPDGDVEITCLDFDDPSFTNQTAPDGSGAFGDNVNDGNDRTLRQSVPVLPGQAYGFAGQVGTDDDNSATDEGEVRLRFLDDTGDVIAGEGATLTDLRSDTDVEFDPFSTAVTAPANADRLRVELRFLNVDDQSYAEVFFDDLSIERSAGVDGAPDARDDGLFTTAADETLAPSSSLFDDNGDGADDLGTPTATLASFGGGDLGGTVGDNAAGSTVPLAGGDLTVNGDGTFSLVDPTDGGRYAFDYRLANGEASDDATVTLLVRDNTVLTPSCEIEDDDSPPGWTSTPSDGVSCIRLTEFTNQTVPDGSRVFGHNDDDGKDANTSQVVVVTGDRTYRLSGAYGTDADNSQIDEGTVTLRYLDGSGAVIAGSGDELTGLRSDANTSFDRFETTTTAPAAAERARIELGFVNVDNESYAEVFFDDVAFDLREVSPTAVDDGPLAVPPSGTLTTSVFDDTGAGADDRGVPTATVESFGGGDLGGTVDDVDANATAAVGSGTVRVDADGTLVATGLARGTYAFEYRLRNSVGTDTATVTVEAGPEAAVVGSGVEIVDGDDNPLTLDGTRFGRVPIEDGPATATFVVENRGSTPLAIDDANLTGAGVAAFALTDGPNATVAPGGETTFDVTFDPVDEGVRTATVSLDTNDPDEDPYDFAIRGTAVDPLEATTGNASDVTPSSATVSATVDPGGDPVDVAFEYSPTGDPGATTTVAADPATASGLDDVPVNATLTGLSPGTTYTYRVTVDNGTTTVAGGTATLSTPVVPPTATTGTVSNVTTTEATVEGTVTTGGGSTAVEFVLAPVADPGATTTVPAAETPVTGAGARSVSAALSGLDSQTAYVVRAVATNPAGTATGANVTFETASEPPAFVASGPFATNESRPVGTVVGDVDAVDGDGGAVDRNVTYDLDGAPDPDGDGTAAFAVDPATGVLTVADPDDVDHEVASSVDLDVEVVDDAGESASATVTVAVGDVAPTLANGSLGSVRESAPVGTVVGTVPVGGDTTSVTVALAGATPNPDGDNASAFAVDSATGVVTVADPDDLAVDDAATVAVTVTATDGTTRAEATFDVTVTAEDRTPPNVYLPDRTVAQGAPVTFVAGASDAGRIVSYEWSFGDGTSARWVQPTHTYATPGIYTVTVRVTDAAGNEAIERATVTVRDGVPPRARLDAPSTAVVGESVRFDAGNSSDNVAVVGYEWTFGDGTSKNDSVATATHAFAAPGSYPVAVTVRDAEGFTDVATVEVRVEAPTPFPAGLPGDPSVTPGDPDGDGVYEDVDGDGAVDFLDVLTLLFADWTAIGADPAQRDALDFDGDGAVGFLDVLTLLFDGG